LRPHLYHQGTLLLQALHQPLGGTAVVLIHDKHFDFGRAIAASAEDDGENAEENHRQDETKCERATVPAQRDESGSYNGGDQSRNSLPVKCKKTDSRFGLRSETSRTSNPALAAASRSAPISAGCSNVNCAPPLTAWPPRSMTHAATRSSSSAKRTTTW